MLTAGTTVDGYVIEDLLGEGGMATVYRARQISLNRVVALKVLAQRWGDDSAFRQRFERECEVQAGFDHPNIVPVFEAGTSDYGLWLAMRLVRGLTLRELLASGHLGSARTLKLLTPIASALDVAHGHGLIHRDITPQNILIDERDHPYLADFGITKSRGDRNLTRTGKFLGTWDYVAPEQIQGQQTTAATDVYSLAAILFECLTGQVPFDKESEVALLFAHVYEQPPRASGVEARLPAAVDDVLGRGLAKDPAMRYATASELLAAASSALGKVGGRTRASAVAAQPPSLEKKARVDRRAPTRTGEGPPSLRDAAPARERRLGAPWLAFAVSTLLLAVGVGIGAASGGDPRPPAEPSVVASGAIAVELPPDWRGARGGGVVPGLRLGDPMTLVPGDRTGREAVLIGLSRATGKSLLPTALRVGGPRVPGAPVDLGELEALRYERLRADGVVPVPLTLFVSPATLGTVTMICRPSAGAGGAFLERCEQLAATLRLRRGRGYPLGASPALARALRRQVSSLVERRRALRRRLAAAGTAPAQSTAASELALAFRDAARGLSSRRVTPQSAAGLAAILAALRASRDAYKELATAAKQEEPIAYAGAAAKVAAGEDLVDSRLSGMRKLGYRIAGRPLRGPPGKQNPSQRGKDQAESG